MLFRSRTVLRALEDLNAHERQMYELNNDKDQVMTVCKVALANLGMWVRDQYFPATYAHARFCWQTQIRAIFAPPARSTRGKIAAIAPL